MLLHCAIRRGERKTTTITSIYDKTKNKRKTKPSKREASMTNTVRLFIEWEKNPWISMCERANGTCSYVRVLNLYDVLFGVLKNDDDDEEGRNSKWKMKNAKEATHRVQFQFLYGIFRQFVLFTLFWLVSMPLLITSMFQAEWHTASHEHFRSLFSSPIGWNRQSFTSSIFDPLFQLECLHPAFFGIAVNVFVSIWNSLKHLRV